MVIYDPLIIDSQLLQLVHSLTRLPQGPYLATVAQDRFIEKNYLLMNQHYYIPFALVQTEADIKVAIETLGFPCVLKPVKRNKRTESWLVLYSEQDFFKLTDYLTGESFILETIVRYKQKIRCTLAKGAKGKAILFPLTQEKTEKGYWKNSSTPLGLGIEQIDEMQNITQKISKELNVLGLISITFYITDNNTIFIKEIDYFPQNALFYTLDWNQSFSQYDAHVRSLCHLPLNDLNDNVLKFISVGIQEENLAAMNTQLLIRNDWHFRYLNKHFITTKEVIGIISVFGPSKSKLEKELLERDIIL